MALRDMDTDRIACNEKRHRERYFLSAGGVIVCALLVTAAVYLSAWISDDAFITLRYVDNTLNGHGATFNIGERVQGYTHPLWFVLLTVAASLIHDQILATTLLCLGLTLLLLIFWARTLLAHAENPASALLVFLLACSVLVSSDFWVSFQTGGLENPLAHLLIVFLIAEIYYCKVSRPERLLAYLCLLCLTRPDFVFFSFPFVVAAVSRLRSFRAFALSLLAVSPGIIWLIFAWMYYGSILPNTGGAKLGVYPHVMYAVQQGVVYAIDWCMFDTWAVVAALAAVLFCIRCARSNKTIIIVVAGIFLHCLWVVSIGGDFMRGRFFMPVLMSALVLGSFCVVDRYADISVKVRKHQIGLLAILAASGFVQCVWNNVYQDNAGVGFIVNERKVWPGNSLKAYLRGGISTRQCHGLDLAEELRLFAEMCGPVTVHYCLVGKFGYVAGPMVSIIDTWGLNDRYIANLPGRFQIKKVPRPGHIDKYIPVDYLARRGDILLIPGWRERIRSFDCSLTESTKEFIGSSAYLKGSAIVHLDLVD